MNDERVLMDRISQEFPNHVSYICEEDVVIRRGSLVWRMPITTQMLETELALARSWFEYR